jgi:hypothetical protein
MSRAIDTDNPQTQLFTQIMVPRSLDAASRETVLVQYRLAFRIAVVCVAELAAVRERVGV